MSEESTLVYLFRNPSWTHDEAIGVYKIAREIILRKFALPSVEVSHRFYEACYTLPSYDLAEHFVDEMAKHLVAGKSVIVLRYDEPRLPTMSAESLTSLMPLKWLSERRCVFEATRAVLHNNYSTASFLIVGLDDAGLASYVKLKWDAR